MNLWLLLLVVLILVGQLFLLRELRRIADILDGDPPSTLYPLFSRRKIAQAQRTLLDLDSQRAALPKGSPKLVQLLQQGRLDLARVEADQIIEERFHRDQSVKRLLFMRQANLDVLGGRATLEEKLKEWEALNPMISWIGDLRREQDREWELLMKDAKSAVT